MITMYVKKRILSKEQHNACISGNSDYRIKFVLDDEWAGRTITARFVSRLVCRNVCKDVLLDESGECNIPIDVLTPGILKVGLFSDKNATTMCDIEVSPSILDMIAKQLGESTETSDSIYREILERLDSMQAGEVTEEVIASAIEKYLEENPVSSGGSGVTTEVDEETLTITGKFVEITEETLIL